MLNDLKEKQISHLYKKPLVAIDFDGTMMRSSAFNEAEFELWRNIANSFRDAGWDVIIATMRSGKGESKREVEAYLAQAKLEIPIVFCWEWDDKKSACKYNGYEPDVWIDDMPYMIGK